MHGGNHLGRTSSLARTYRHRLPRRERHPKGHLAVSNKDYSNPNGMHRPLHLLPQVLRTRFGQACDLPQGCFRSQVPSPSFQVDLAHDPRPTVESVPTRFFQQSHMQAGSPCLSTRSSYREEIETPGGRTPRRKIPGVGVRIAIAHCRGLGQEALRCG